MFGGKSFIKISVCVCVYVHTKHMIYVYIGYSSDLHMHIQWAAELGDNSWKTIMNIVFVPPTHLIRIPIHSVFSVVWYLFLALGLVYTIVEPDLT